LRHVYPNARAAAHPATGGDHSGYHSDPAASDCDAGRSDHYSDSDRDASHHRANHSGGATDHGANLGWDTSTVCHAASAHGRGVADAVRAAIKVCRGDVT